ncbi:DNA-binding response regulator [Anaerobacillus alkaliphilus]|uniref:DNA-binding response regulator n=1 Tax=Anaerobacillus alkaliphilus TaxID=1548597 RepID=A0A4Q0VUL3_9BACI|nr:response regulator transcription factor [Anaerobacillus alkaliphilus]RXJ02076.1 DNA-binding response regulator [Anaerobacillus alkaliphilus]
MNRVLLVDDEVFVRKGLSSLINWEQYGFEISWEADNGEDAFKIILEEKPDLVITDVRMPVVDGLTLIKKVREIENETKFIIISGYNDFSYAQQAVRYNVLDFVLKPVDQDELEETLYKLSQRLKLEEIESEKQQKVIAEQIITQILEGTFEENEEAEWTRYLNLEKEAYYYLLVELNNLTHVDDEATIKTLVTEVPEIILKLTDQKNQMLVQQQPDYAVGILLPESYLKTYKGDIAVFSSEFKKILKQKSNKEMTVCIGAKAKNISELKKSYETANQIRHYKYILENAKEQSINYETVKDIEVKYNELDAKIYISLMEQVEENNIEAIKKTVDQIFLEFQTKIFTPKSVKTSIDRCVHGIIQTVNDMDGDKDSFSTLKAMLDWEDDNLTLHELKQRLYSFIIEGSTIIQSLRKENMKGDIHKIKSYIENNYHQNISLKSIANKFYMNPVYMGQLFKKTFGVYFKEFLLKIRIDEAKKLLRQTDMRVYEVADKVGFGSTDYFVTQFEKINKLTPTEYRNQLLKNNVE